MRVCERMVPSLPDEPCCKMDATLRIFSSVANVVNYVGSRIRAGLFGSLSSD